MEESQKDKDERNRKAMEEIMNLPVGSMNTLLVDAVNTKKEWIGYNGARYELEFKPIPYERYLQLVMETWSACRESQKLYSLMIQVAQMKEILVSVGGMPCTTTFWHTIDPMFAETLRIYMFGESDLDPKPDSDMIKNLLPVLMDYVASGRNGISLPTQNPNEDQHRSSEPEPTIPS